MNPPAHPGPMGEVGAFDVVPSVNGVRGRPPWCWTCDRLERAKEAKMPGA